MGYRQGCQLAGVTVTGPEFVARLALALGFFAVIEAIDSQMSWSIWWVWSALIGLAIAFIDKIVVVIFDDF